MEMIRSGAVRLKKERGNKLDDCVYLHRSIRHRVARSNNTKNNFSGGFRSMLIARHPIDRLRSAFMDKFVRGNYSE